MEAKRTRPVAFVGKKGRSGRKSSYEEYVKKAVIEKSWEKLLKMLENPKADHKELLTIALTIAPRTIKNEVAISGSEELDKLNTGIKSLTGGNLKTKPNDDITVPRSM